MISQSSHKEKNGIFSHVPFNTFVFLVCSVIVWAFYIIYSIFLIWLCSPPPVPVSVRCPMAPAVCRTAQWVAPCCHWQTRHRHWACVLIQVPQGQRCKRMALSIPALRKYTHILYMHTHTHTFYTCAHTHANTHIAQSKSMQSPIHQLNLEDEQYLPWWIFFLFVLWMSVF